MPMGVIHVPREPEQVITRDTNEQSEATMITTMDTPMTAANVQNDENESSPTTPSYQPIESGEDWGYEPNTQQQIEAVARMEEPTNEENESNEEETCDESDKNNQVPDID